MNLRIRYTRTYTPNKKKEQNQRQNKLYPTLTNTTPHPFKEERPEIAIFTTLISSVHRFIFIKWIVGLSQLTYILFMLRFEGNSNRYLNKWRNLNTYVGEKTALFFHDKSRVRKYAKWIISMKKCNYKSLWLYWRLGKSIYFSIAQVFRRRVLYAMFFKILL